MITYIGEKWLGLQQAMHSGYYTLFIRSFNCIFLFNEFSWRDQKLYKELSTCIGYGTVRSKTSSSRDDLLQNHFSNGTVHPGTVRSICKKINKSIFKKWKSFLMNCEHHSRDEPF